MTLPTNYGDAWWLVKEDPKVIVEELRDSEGTLTGYRKRYLFVVVQERLIFNVTSFRSDVGETKSSFNVKTGPATAIAVSYTGKKFVCDAHSREINNAETGCYVERQTWIHKSDGEIMPPDAMAD